MTTLEEVLEYQKRHFILKAPTAPSDSKGSKVISETPLTLDIALKNTTNSSNCWAYVTGLDIAKNNAVFILQSDGATPYYPVSPSGTLEPLQADCHIQLGAPGSSKTVTIPRIAGGRVWLCRDSQLTFRLNPGPAVVEPSVTNPSDPNYNLFWSFVEFTFNDFQLFGNITYVDYVSLPISLTLENQSGQIQNVEGVPAGGLETVCSKLVEQNSKDNAGWDQLIIKDPTGAQLRALSPNSAIIMTADLFKNYYQPYVDSVWTKYATDTLTVDTQNKWGVVTGKVTNGKLTFADVGDFDQPSAADIFACNSGPFAGRETNTDEMGNITARLAAAFNRSTLLTNSNQPAGEVVSNYYRETVTNHYSRIVHETVANGKGYAFPYDDVAASDDANVAGTVSDTNPKLLTVTFGGNSGASSSSSSTVTTRVPVSDFARTGGSGRQQVARSIFPRGLLQSRYVPPADEEKAALAQREATGTDAVDVDLERGLSKLLADSGITAPERAQRAIPAALRALLEKVGLGATAQRARPALDALVAAVTEILRVSIGSLVGRAVVVTVLVLGSFVLGLFWEGGEGAVNIVAE